MFVGKLFASGSCLQQFGFIDIGGKNDPLLSTYLSKFLCLHPYHLAVYKELYGHEVSFCNFGIVYF